MTEGEIPKPEIQQPEMINIEAKTWEESSRSLGFQMKERIHGILNSKLATITVEQRNEQFSFIRQSFDIMQNKSNGGTFGWLMQEYLENLSAWSAGAELESLASKINEDDSGDSVTPLELALWLQNDNVGCISGLVRLEGDEIVLMHWEEDSTGIIDRPRIAKISVGDNDERRNYYAFLYPHLLPGPAFTFDGFKAMAVDFIPPPYELRPGVLANSLVWMLWRLGDFTQAEALVEEMKPFVDGYVVNCAWVDRNQVRAQQQIFGLHESVIKKLPSEPNSVLVGTNNVLEEDAPELASQLNSEDIKYQGYKHRRIVLQEIFDRIRRSLGKLDFEILSRVLGYRIFPKLNQMDSATHTKLINFGLSNPDIQAAMIARFNSDGLTHWRIVPGQPLPANLKKLFTGIT